MHSPKNLYIQLTNKCNNNCSVCMYRLDPLYKSSNSIMSDSVIQKLLENIKRIDTLETVYFGPMYGEAQLHPKFYRVVEAIKNIKPELFIILITNGILLTKDSISKYVGDHVHISVLGNKTNPNTYESITGLKWGDLRKKAEIVLHAGTAYGYNFTMTTLDDVEEAMQDLYLEEGFQSLYYVFSYPSDIKKYLTKCSYLNTRYKVSKANNSGHNFDDILIKNNLEHLVYRTPRLAPCAVLYDDIAITCHGDVLLCACADIPMKGIIGNIKDQSVLEIYNNKLINFYRDSLIKGIKPGMPCNLCTDKIDRQKLMYKTFEVSDNV